ncbi:MAG: hypothetical protein ACK47C_10955 [Paracoccaceae bacterium]
MRSFLVLAFLALPAAPALAEITVTNGRGDNAVISRDCEKGEGQVTCTRETIVTGAEGKTAKKTKVRTAERGLLTAEVTVTGPEGNTRTRERSWTRND